ncbi:LADA_0D07888g1_1 [Lachancea dasiensis]|uniref:Spindle pole body component n=1 Tax=Lachancea dasiensis TaxID=1072105 RepID=A0A1G4J778_9SACH|nr:LADA_0D07888g1_1 [Lachancea dasiensis]
MDLKANLLYIIRELVSSSLPDALITGLQEEASAVVASPSVSVEQMTRIVNKYKKRAIQTMDSLSRWQKLEGLLQLVTTSPNEEEASAYVQLMRNTLLDVHSPHHQRSPRMSQDSVLSSHLLSTHDNLVTPIKGSRNSPGYAESFENIDRYSDRRSIVSSNYGMMAGARHDMVTLSSLADPYFSATANELEIRECLPFTLLATTSHMFSFDKSGIHIPTSVPNGESGMLHILFEAGLLYCFLQKQVEVHRAESNVSPLKVAFLSFVDDRVHEYMIRINQISNSPQIQSLKAFYVEIVEWLVEFRIYYKLVTDFHKMRGDQLVSRIYDLKEHGDLTVQRVFKSLYCSLALLYYEYLANWLTRGQLETYQEFFIERIEPSKHDSANLKLNSEKIPSFIPLTTAEEIFIIGKTYLYLEKDCLEIQWTNGNNQKYTRIYDTLKGSELSLEFRKTVHYHYFEITSFCRETLEDKFSFRKVLQMLRDVLFMGKGDFIDQMIHNSADFLQQPSATLPSYKLTRCLHESIKQSSLKFMLGTSQMSKIVDGIDARVLELGHGSIGWDVFTLDYLAERPLATLLNFKQTGGRNEYLRIFNFLWRIKKNNYFFQNEWLRNNSLMRDFRQLRRNRPFMRDVLRKMSKINALKFNVLHINRKLENHCFRYIIEENYACMQMKMTDDNRPVKSTMKITQIKNGLRVVQGILKPNPLLISKITSDNSTGQQETSFSIDELQEIHDDYLQQIINHRLLDSTSQNSKKGAFSNQYYPSTLIMLLGDIYGFIVLYSNFNDIIHELLIVLSLQSGSEVTKLLTSFNTLLSDIVTNYKRIQSIAYYLIKDLKADGDTELLSLSKILR